MSAPNFMRAANDGLNSVNDSAADVDVQWSPGQPSTLGWIFPRPDANASSKMTDLTRQEVDAKLAQNKAELEARLANFDTSIKTGFAEMRTDMAKMQGEMHKNTSDLIKWGVVTALGFATATVAILTFVINNAIPKTPPAQPVSQPAAQQQVPTIIAVPSGSTVLSAPQAPAVTAPPPAKQSN